MHTYPFKRRVETCARHLRMFARWSNIKYNVNLTHKLSLKIYSYEYCSLETRTNTGPGC